MKIGKYSKWVIVLVLIVMTSLVVYSLFWSINQQYVWTMVGEEAVIFVDPTSYVADFSDLIPDLNDSERLALKQRLLSSVIGNTISESDAESLLVYVADLIGNTSPYYERLNISLNLLIGQEATYNGYLETNASKPIIDLLNKELMNLCGGYPSTHYYGTEAVEVMGYETYIEIEEAYLNHNNCSPADQKILHLIAVNSSDRFIMPCYGTSGWSIIDDKVVYYCEGNCSINASTGGFGEMYMVSLNGYNCSYQDAYLDYVLSLLINTNSS